MSEGATTSEPARACETAAFVSSGSVASLSTSPSRMTPQWPCDVYSSRQTSVITRSSGTSLLKRRTVSCTAPPSSQASLPVSSFFSGMPNRMTAGMPAEKSSRASPRASSGERRETPGRDVIGSFFPFPCRTKSGATKRSGERRVSRTSARIPALRRRRRMRTVGYDMWRIYVPEGAAASRSRSARASNRASSVTRSDRRRRTRSGA